MSDSLWPHELQHARPPCPSPTPGVYQNSRPSSWWCHPAISSSVVTYTYCLQSHPASVSFPMSQLFAWAGQSTGVSAWASFLSKEIPGLIPFRMDWLDLLAVQGTLKILLHQYVCVCLCVYIWITSRNYTLTKNKYRLFCNDEYFIKHKHQYSVTVKND